ncbi:MAG: hypothetical protein A3K68_05405 [Euryarchaeota archaeon RBG_16_68_13]|nr:MAG: hypothetical protein A3K68_05405 [Euryarchaeota archaeon RBG_16_68_13]
MPDVWRLGAGPEQARIAVVGCGGAGCNTLRRLGTPSGWERIAVNDAPHPSMAGIPQRILVRPDVLRSFASMDERAVQNMETHEERDLSTAILDRDVVIALGGLGGNLGGWAMSLVGRVARILGDTTVALATVPFGAEGALRREAAQEQLDLLRRKCDGVVTFANDALLRLAPNLPLVKSFAVLGSVMSRFTTGLGTSVSREDAVPLKRFLARSREWRYGMGSGSEKHRCFLAVDEAYASPWFASRPEDLRQAIVLMGMPPGGGFEEEILHEIRVRSPGVDLAWGVLPETAAGDRVVVQILGGL